MKPNYCLVNILVGPRPILPVDLVVTLLLRPL